MEDIQTRLDYRESREIVPAVIGCDGEMIGDNGVRVLCIRGVGLVVCLFRRASSLLWCRACFQPSDSSLSHSTKTSMY